MINHLLPLSYLAACPVPASISIPAPVLLSSDVDELLLHKEQKRREKTPLCRKTANTSVSRVQNKAEADGEAAARLPDK